jgi:REP element-mobilizing transposase RayT
MVIDHVHMIVVVPPVFDLPRLVQGLKGASARIANRDGHSSPRPLRWAGGYDARSVGVSRLAAAVRYVERQSARHPERAIGLVE